MASLVLPKSGDSTRAGVFPVSPSAAAGNVGNRPTEFRWSSVPLLGPEGQGSAHHVLELLEGIVPPEEPTQEIDDPVAVRDWFFRPAGRAPELLGVPFTEGGPIVGAERGVVGILGAAGGTTLHRFSGGAVAWGQSGEAEAAI